MQIASFFICWTSTLVGLESESLFLAVPVAHALQTGCIRHVGVGLLADFGDVSLMFFAQFHLCGGIGDSCVNLIVAVSCC